MKSVRYLAISFCIFIIAFGVIYFTGEFTGAEPDFDSFQQTAGKGSFSSVEKNKSGNLNTIIFKDVKIYVGGDDEPFLCSGIISATTEDDDAAKKLMKFRYDLLSYAQTSLSMQTDFSEEALVGAASETAKQYNEKRGIPADIKFSFENLSCSPVQ